MGAYFESAHHKSIIWTLIDSDESQSGLPDEFAPQNMPFLLFTPHPQQRNTGRDLARQQTIQLLS